METKTTDSLEKLIGISSSIQNQDKLKIYSDDYIHAINKSYPLNEILGEYQKGIAKGSWDALDHFTLDSPLQHSEGEDVLNAILYHSANCNMWQPKVIEISKLTDTPIKTAKEYIEAIERVNLGQRSCMIDRGTLFGIKKAKSEDFVHVTSLDNNVIVLPSIKFIEYCKTKGEK